MFGPVKYGGPTRIRTEDRAIMSRIELLSRPMSAPIYHARLVFVKVRLRAGAVPRRSTGLKLDYFPES